MAQDGQPIKIIGIRLTHDDYSNLKQAAAAANVPTRTDAGMVYWAINVAVSSFLPGRPGNVSLAGVAGEGLGDGQGGPSPDSL